MEESSYIKGRTQGQTHLSKAAFSNDFKVVKITGFDPKEEKKIENFIYNLFSFMFVKIVA